MYNHKELKEQIIQAAYKSVTELIKVLADEIISENNDEDITADKMRNAVLAKKQALDDAFYILDKIQREQDILEENPNTKKDEPKFESFAEKRSNKGK
jgi:hypothetical protein